MSDANLKSLVPRRTPISKQGLRFVLATIGIAAGILVGFGLLGFRINLTPSYPLGLWQITNDTPKKGDLVMFDFPTGNPLALIAHDRGYLRDGASGYMPLMKRLAAVAGDKVTIGDHVEINGTPWPNGDIRQVDSNGREVLSVASSEIVKTGTCWLLSDYNPRSFDSRYFGAVSTHAITAVARPIFVIQSEF